MNWLKYLTTAGRFAVFYAGEILVSNLRVARDVLAARPAIAPGIVTIPLGDLNDRQTLVLAALLTMTPGTLSLEVERTRRRLHVHTLYRHPSPDQLRESVKRNYVDPLRILL